MSRRVKDRCSEVYLDGLLFVGHSLRYVDHRRLFYCYEGRRSALPCSTSHRCRQLRRTVIRHSFSLGTNSSAAFPSLEAPLLDVDRLFFPTKKLHSDAQRAATITRQSNEIICDNPSWEMKGIKSFRCRIRRCCSRCSLCDVKLHHSPSDHL